jgi:hypothetical protein
VAVRPVAGRGSFRLFIGQPKRENSCSSNCSQGQPGEAKADQRARFVQQANVGSPGPSPTGRLEPPWSMGIRKEAIENATRQPLSGG